MQTIAVDRFGDKSGRHWSERHPGAAPAIETIACRAVPAIDSTLAKRTKDRMRPGGEGARAASHATLDHAPRSARSDRTACLTAMPVATLSGSTLAK
jgi:hypothetical protein